MVITTPFRGNNQLEAENRKPYLNDDFGREQPYKTRTPD